MKHINLLLICILGLILSSCHDEMFDTLKGRTFRSETSTDDLFSQYEFNKKKEIVVWRSYNHRGTVKWMEVWYEYETSGKEIKLYMYESTSRYANGETIELNLKHSGWKDKPTDILQYHETYLVDEDGSKYVVHSQR